MEESFYRAFREVFGDGILLSCLNSAGEVKVSGEEVVLKVPNRFILEMVAERKRELEKKMGKSLTIMVDASLAPEPRDESILEEIEISGRVVGTSSLPHNFALENYVVADCNREAAYVAINTTAGYIDGKPVQPVFVFGPPGVGKTHLLIALCREFIKTGMDATFYRSEKFFDDVMRSFKTGSTPFLIEKVASTEALFLDDFHFFARKSIPSVNDVLFAVLNAFVSEQKLTIVTSDTHINDSLFSRLPLRIRQRVITGGIVKISPPGPDFVTECLRMLCEENEMEVEEGVAERLSEIPFSSARDVISACNGLIQRTLLKRKKIVELRDLEEFLPESAGDPLYGIAREVSARMGVYPDRITAPLEKGDRRGAEAKAVFAFAASRRGFSYSKIAEFLGGVSKSYVHKLLKRVEGDPDLKKLAEELCRKER